MVPLCLAALLKEVRRIKPEASLGVSAAALCSPVHLLAKIAEIFDCRMLFRLPFGSNLVNDKNGMVEFLGYLAKNITLIELYGEKIPLGLVFIHNTS